MASGIARALHTPSRPASAALVAAVLAAVVASACGLGTTSPVTQGPSEGASSPPASASGGPTPTVSPAPTAVPLGSPSTTPGSSPGESPLPTPASSGDAAVAACFGSADTKGFFGSFADAVDWPVYCAVLPSGWSVVSGTFHLGNGGTLSIQYRRKADDARLTLDEGSYCTVATGCVPSGTAAGPVTVGGMDGHLIATDGGGYAAIVASGEQPSWRLTSTGLDQATFTDLAGALFLIER